MGYVLAALTSGGDVYCWGDVTRNGGALSHCSCLNLSENFGAPVPIVIQNNHAHNQQQEAEAEEEEDGKDIADIAVGDAHMLALTRDGEVYVLGDNSNGQLGMDPQAVGVVTGWTRVDLDGVLRSREEKVVGVVAGTRTSFLITERTST